MIQYFNSEFWRLFKVEKLRYEDIEAIAFKL